MKKKTLMKDTFREVRNTKSRFISIMLIISLGVGFFVGIKATAPSVFATAENYFESHNLMDIEILSTVGFDDDDITAISEIKGVESVMPSYSVDLIMEHENGSGVVRVMSLPSDSKSGVVNEPELIEGRYPEKPNECITIATDVLKNQYKIGDVIQLSGTTETPDPGNILSESKYKIVGIIKSPMYFSIYLGTTSVGNGTLMSYAYIPASNFLYKRYTEVYLTLSANPEISIFDDEYDRIIDDISVQLEKTGTERFEIFLKNAENEVKIAEAELNEKSEESEQLLSESKTELDNAKKQIEDAMAELDAGWKEYKKSADIAEIQIQNAGKEIDAAKAEVDKGELTLVESRRKYEAALTEAQKEFANARDELDAAWNKLAESRKQLDDGWAEYNKNYKIYADGVEEFNKKKSEYEASVVKLNEGVETYNKNKAEYDKNNALYIQGLADYEKGLKEYEAGLQKYNDAEQELKKGREEYKKNYDEYIIGLEKYNKGLQQFEIEYSKYEESLELYESKKNEFDAAKKLYEAALEEYNYGYGQYLDAVRQLEEGKQQLAEGKEQLAENKKKYADGLAQYQAAEQQYNEGVAALEQFKAIQDSLLLPPAIKDYIEAEQAKLDEAKVRLDQAKAELDAADNEIKEAEARIAESEKEIAEKEAILAENKKPLDEAKAKLGETKTQLDAGEYQLNEGANQLNEAGAKLDEARAELTDSKAVLDAAYIQLQEAEKKIEDGEKALDKSAVELETGKKTLDDTKIQLDRAKVDLDNGKIKLDEGKKEIEENQKLLNDAKTALNEGELQINESKKKLDAAKAELDGYEAEYYSNKVKIEESEEQYQTRKAAVDKELADSLNKIVQGEAELKDARQKIAESEKELQDARKKAQTELKSAESGLLDSEEQINESHKKYAEGLSEYEKAVRDADEAIKDGQKRIQKARNDLSSIENGKWYILSRDDSIIYYTNLSEDIKNIDALADVFPVFFLMIAALICLSTMSRMIDEQRIQIGTYKALGYSSGSIALKYIIYALSAGILGSITGQFLGVIFLPRAIFGAYKKMYSFPDFITEIPWTASILAFAVALFCTAAVAWFCCRADLKTNTAMLMRPKAPKSGKTILLEKIKPLWRKLGFSQKITARNIFRSKVRLAMTVAGIMGCMGLIVTGFGLQDALSSIMSKQFGEIYNYDMTISFSKEYDKEQINSLYKEFSADSRIKNLMFARYSSVSAKNPENDNIMNDINMMVPQDTAKLKEMVNLKDAYNGNELTPDNNSVVITQKLAEKLKISAGDILTVNYKNDEYKIRISAIAENYLMNYIYITPELYVEIFGEVPGYNSALAIKSDELEDSDEFITDWLSKNKDILAISMTETVADVFDEVLQNLNAVIYIMILSAGALAFIVVFNLTNINISERIREIATIKVLGFRNMEVNMYIFKENIIMGIAGILFGIAAGFFMTRFIVSTIEIDMLMFGRKIELSSFLFAAFLTLIFAVMVNVAMSGRIKNISMVESLKAIE